MPWSGAAQPVEPKLIRQRANGGSGEYIGRSALTGCWGIFGPCPTRLAKRPLRNCHGSASEHCRSTCMTTYTLSRVHALADRFNTIHASGALPTIFQSASLSLPQKSTRSRRGLATSLISFSEIAHEMTGRQCL